METAPLKSFATWARVALIREVTARIAVVLAQASPERVELPGAVEALERAVNTAGGGAIGRAGIADKVAYTWFNRIIALRFMDANGYTGVGVVSPQAGADVSQPEILAEAKRGNVDAEVVSNKTRDTVAGLLNGTRRSNDAQGEAYALLLADYCRYWNRSMPFMFERAGDFTEMLIPANLLADDSVLNRAVNVLTALACQDVEIIGWLYQFYVSERKDDVFASFKVGKKAGADEIPAATQLFTPHWIVRYLVENSLGRLWMLNRPSSRLIDGMNYYVAPLDKETGFLKISRLEEIKVIDPACGSGHMLTYAFDLLYDMYEEEGYAPAEIPTLILTNNLYGVEIDPRAGALAAFALTMKARAKQRTFFSKQIESNVSVLDPISFTPDEIDFLMTRGGNKHAETGFWNQFEHADVFGSLIQPDGELAARLEHHVSQFDDRGEILLADTLHRAHRVLCQAKCLRSKYAVVVTNPPYMGAGNMNATLTAFVRANYLNAKQDLYACFVQRATGLVLDTGLIAMILGDTWMSIKSFEEFRRQLLDHHAFASFVHLRDVSNHPDIFGANGAFVLDVAGKTDVPVAYFRLTPLNEDEKRRRLLAAITDPESPDRYACTTDDLARLPGIPIAYWLSNAMRAAFTRGKPLGEVAAPRNGLSTSDNDQFLRMWWEVAASRTDFGGRSLELAARSSARWFPLNKGGEYRRWYGNQSHMVNWENDGKAVKSFIVHRYPYLNGNPGIKVRSTETYFLPQLSWSGIGSGAPAFREYPAGLIFDGAAKAIFPSSESTRRELLGALNSSVVTQMLSAIAPTLNFEAGQIARLPVLDSLGPTLRENVEQLVSVSKLDWDSYETSWDFAAPPWLVEPGEHAVSPTRASALPMGARLEDRIAAWSSTWAQASGDQQVRETENNRIVAEAYGVEDEVPIDVALNRVSLTRNVEFRYGPGKTAEEYAFRELEDFAKDLVSYAVGCMFGRYSLDEPGLLLVDQGAAAEDYLAKVPNPLFMPDKDNVIPVVDGDWFEDDIVAQFRQFLRAAFGEQHFEENLRFVTEALGVNYMRGYFVKSFYKDHLQRYKKRPIYWLFSSPKGSFNALIYMHRYTSSTVSTVLNEYLREFTAKLTSSLQQQDRLAAGGGTPRQQAAAQKEADRLRRVLLELEEYEHDVLYPLASRQLAIDLDDGVKVNYPKFGAALKKIVGLEASDE